MNRILSAITILGIIVAEQPVLAIPPKPQILGLENLQSANQMTQMLSAWGFVPTVCQESVAEIRNSSTGEIACVQPNAELGVGKFVYDALNNQIHRENQSVTPKKNEGNLGYVNPVPQTEELRIAEMVFTFNNLYDYGTCLDAILLAYEGRELELQNMTKNQCANNVINLFGSRLSKDIALQLIDLANFRATNLLQSTLYPSFGLRRRVAINLGYIYDIDKENREMLKYITSNR